MNFVPPGLLLSEAELLSLSFWVRCWVTDLFVPLSLLSLYVVWALREEIESFVRLVFVLGENSREGGEQNPRRLRLWPANASRADWLSRFCVPRGGVFVRFGG